MNASRSFSSILVFQVVFLLVLVPDETLEQGQNVSWWLNPFLDFVFFLLCLHCFVFSAALRNFTTRPSHCSSWMAVLLPLSVCLYIVIIQ